MAKRAKKGFLLPPAVGYSLEVWTGMLLQGGISIRYLHRVILTYLVSLINWPFRNYERLLINPKYRKAPSTVPKVFILGHWRSGTTHLHNLMSQDARMGYVSTYQSVFPDTLRNYAGRFLFEGFAKLLIPGTRKGDNVVLGTELPQEEEFALADKTGFSFYNYWMFPRGLRKDYKFIDQHSAPKRKLEAWKDDYRLLITKAMKSGGGSIFLSKNPPNTGRLELLAEMFPEAKFVHIHRNPIEVFLSTRNFFRKMMPHLQVQTISDERLQEDVFWLYDRIMKDYLQQRDALHGQEVLSQEDVSKKKLVEISFDDLEARPLVCLEEIYSTLELGAFEEAKPAFEDYLSSKKSYQKNRHSMKRSELERIQKTWAFAFEEWDYGIPENIDIEEDLEKKETIENQARNETDVEQVKKETNSRER